MNKILQNISISESHLHNWFSGIGKSISSVFHHEDAKDELIIFLVVINIMLLALLFNVYFHES